MEADGRTDGQPDGYDRSFAFRDNASAPTNQTKTETSNTKTWQTTDSVVSDA